MWIVVIQTCKSISRDTGSHAVCLCYSVHLVGRWRLVSVSADGSAVGDLAAWLALT